MYSIRTGYANCGHYAHVHSGDRTNMIAWIIITILSLLRGSPGTTKKTKPIISDGVSPSQTESMTPPDTLRDAPFGGGGARVFVVCKLFSYLRWKTSFFLRSTPDNFFFYVISNNFFVVCFPYYVRYHLVFFLVNIFFINFDNNFFFSDFCGDKQFFQF